MTRFVCHLVPLLSLCVCVGCFLDHGRGAGARDAGPTAEPDAGGDPPPRIVDAGRPPPSMPPPPPPTTCPQVRADATCLESFLLPPRVAFELPIAFDSCGCCAETECIVEVDRESQRLWLTTALCPDPCDCAACMTPRGSCEVPPLDVGEWVVSVNGRDGFVLPVMEDPGFAPPPPACATYAQPDGCAPSDPLEGPPLVADEVCVSASSTDDVRIELVQDCPICELGFGPCDVSVEPRFTDDLPPGGEIRVAARNYVTACDVACTAECVQSTRTCFVPPLTPGHLYRVWVDGAEVTSFTAGHLARTCTR